MEFAELDRRPILVAIAGPDRAGKTECFHAHLTSAGLRFANADVLAGFPPLADEEKFQVEDAAARHVRHRNRPVGPAPPPRWLGAIEFFAIGAGVDSGFLSVGRNRGSVNWPG
jgi:hypothetical protein